MTRGGIAENVVLDLGQYFFGQLLFEETRGKRRRKDPDVRTPVDQVVDREDEVRTVDCVFGRVRFVLAKREPLHDRLLLVGKIDLSRDAVAGLAAEPPLTHHDFIMGNSDAHLRKVLPRAYLVKRPDPYTSSVVARELPAFSGKSSQSASRRSRAAPCNGRGY